MKTISIEKDGIFLRFTVTNPFTGEEDMVERKITDYNDFSAMVKEHPLVVKAIDFSIEKSDMAAGDQGRLTGISLWIDESDSQNKVPVKRNIRKKRIVIKTPPYKLTKYTNYILDALIEGDKSLKEIVKYTEEKRKSAGLYTDDEARKYNNGVTRLYQSLYGELSRLIVKKGVYKYKVGNGWVYSLVDYKSKP